MKLYCENRAPIALILRSMQAYTAFYLFSEHKIGI